MNSAMLRAVVVVAGASAAGSETRGQNARLITTMNWIEVVAGSTVPVPAPNGLVDPGEAAMIRLGLSFVPGVGELVRYPIGGGAFALAPVAGFSSVLFSLIPTGASAGAWSHPGSLPGFVADLGFIDPTTSTLLLASAWQPSPPSGQMPLPNNPLPDVWYAVWTPATYQQRLVMFVGQSPSHAGGLFVHTGNDPSGNPILSYAEATATFGQVQISVVPSPSVAAPLLTMGAALLLRRRPDV